MEEKERRVVVQPLTRAAFSAYGQVTGQGEGQLPNLTGDGWACWYPVGELRDATPLFVGLVRTDPRPLRIEAMERHLDRQEWVYALDQPVVQVVALSVPADPGRPDAASVRAFLLQPGQGVVMERGVWHSAGFPAGDESAYYGFVLGQPRPDAEAAGSPWVPLAGDACVVLECPLLPPLEALQARI